MSRLLIGPGGNPVISSGVLQLIASGATAGDCSCCVPACRIECGSPNTGKWLTGYSVTVSGFPSSFINDAVDSFAGGRRYYTITGFDVCNRTESITYNESTCLWTTYSMTFNINWTYETGSGTGCSDPLTITKSGTSEYTFTISSGFYEAIPTGNTTGESAYAWQASYRNTYLSNSCDAQSGSVAVSGGGCGGGTSWSHSHSVSPVLGGP